jgi:hypothetical protein
MNIVTTVIVTMASGTEVTLTRLEPGASAGAIGAIRELIEGEAHDRNQILLAAAEQLVDKLKADAEDRSPVKTGAYRDSIKGEAKIVGDYAVQGRVWTDRYTAWWIEFGADRPAYEIAPNARQALAFASGAGALMQALGSAGRIFAKHVHHPANKMAAINPLHGALDADRHEIEERLRAAELTPDPGVLTWEP